MGRLGHKGGDLTIGGGGLGYWGRGLYHWGRETWPLEENLATAGGDLTAEGWELGNLGSGTWLVLYGGQYFSEGDCGGMQLDMGRAMHSTVNKDSPTSE